MSSFQNLHSFFWTKFVLKLLSSLFNFYFVNVIFSESFLYQNYVQYHLSELHSFFWTQLVFMESSIMLIFTSSISSFQNRFCIMIKFSIIFSESSQFLLNKIRLEHPGGLSKLDGITRGMKWLERCRLNKSPYYWKLFW